MARALPHLATLHAYFGARVGAPAAAAFFKGVRAMERLRELRATAWVPYAPQRGEWPSGALGFLQLGGVTRLVVDGAALSLDEMRVGAPVRARAPPPSFAPGRPRLDR